MHPFSTLRLSILDLISQTEMGYFVHPCENELVCRSTNEKVPKFGSPVYYENKTQIGQVDEIFGPITEVYFTVKPAQVRICCLYRREDLRRMSHFAFSSSTQGFVATSFQPNQKIYINPMSLLPMKMFTEEPKPMPK